MYIELHHEVSKVMTPFTFGLSHVFPSLLLGGCNFLVLAMFGKLCFLFLFVVCCVITEKNDIILKSFMVKDQLNPPLPPHLELSIIPITLKWSSKP